MDDPLTRLDKLSQRVNRYVSCFVGLVILIMFASLFLQVCCRYFLNAPLSWPEEFTMFLMAWMSFVGASVAVRQSGHIGIDFLIGRLAEPGRSYLTVFILVCTLLFSSMLFVEGVRLTADSVGIVSDGMRVSMVYPRLSMPVGAALMTFHSLVMLLTGLRSLKNRA